MQKGENADAIESKLKDIENKNAAAASKSVKTFYTVTVKVCSEIMHGVCNGVWLLLSSRMRPFKIVRRSCK